MCAGLVTVDEESNVVRLVHYATQDYFTRTQDKWFPDAQLLSAKLCITYLSYQDFASGICKSFRKFIERKKLHPFYDYAACNWAHHGRQASAYQQMVSFLQKPNEVSVSAQALQTSTCGWVSRSPGEITGLHLAAYLGLNEVVPYLLGNLNSKDINGRTPLSRAAMGGQEDVVQLLLATEKVNPDSRDYGGRTPLSWAAAGGHEAVVQLLLATEGVNADSNDSNNRTLLSWAAENGREAVVQLLLATEGVNPNSKDSSGWTPLSWAAWKGHRAVVQLLLATEGIDPNSKDSNGQTPLSWAAENGHEAIVQILLATEGVDADAADFFGQTAVSWAAEEGREAIVQLLLATKGADSDSEYLAPLVWTVDYGSLERSDTQDNTFDKSAGPYAYGSPDYGSPDRSDTFNG